jgi:hypothetical protein
MLDDSNIEGVHWRKVDSDRIDPTTGVAPLPRKDLLEHWTRFYGRPPPAGISRRLLVYAAAYAAQVEASGGLNPATRRKIRRIAKQPVKQRQTGSPLPPSSLPAGTRLVRKWQGDVHAVDVLEAGLLYNGSLYGSLSEVARVITGARWSGPRFFGVEQ